VGPTSALRPWPRRSDDVGGRFRQPPALVYSARWIRHLVWSPVRRADDRLDLHRRQLSASGRRVDDEFDGVQEYVCVRRVICRHPVDREGRPHQGK
jgi:hypothetical protein